MKAVVLCVVPLALLVVPGLLRSGEPRPLLPNEIPFGGKQAPSARPVIEGKSWRGWLEATVFPEFVYAGSLDGAVERLMAESRKFSPGGHAVGSFVLRDIEAERVRVNVRLRGRNALELVDALCALSRCNWTLMPHGILIHREPKIQ